MHILATRRKFAQYLGDSLRIQRQPTDGESVNINKNMEFSSGLRSVATKIVSCKLLMLTGKEHIGFPLAPSRCQLGRCNLCPAAVQPAKLARWTKTSMPSRISVKCPVLDMMTSKGCLRRRGLQHSCAESAFSADDEHIFL